MSKYVVTVTVQGGGQHRFVTDDPALGNEMIQEWVTYMNRQAVGSWHIRQFTGFPNVVLRFDLIAAVGVDEYVPSPAEQMLAMQAKAMERESKGEDWRNE